MSRLVSTPWISVTLEFLRALTDLLLLPARALTYSVERESEVSALRSALAEDPEPDPAPELDHWPDRPLVVLVACAEASGEHHALSLLRELRAAAAAAGAPPPRVLGFGGARLAAADVELLGNPVERAAMGFQGVIGALPFYLRLLTSAARAFREVRPDVFIPVDSPALHVPMAHIAQRAGVRVAHFITPQYWGWAPWRVNGYRRAVDLALTILPFEPGWFTDRGVRVRHVGHPIQDHLADVPVGIAQIDGPLVILPGSRSGVIRRNLPWMLEVAAHATDSTRAIEVLQESDEHTDLIDDAIVRAGLQGRAVLRRGKLHDHLRGARAAFSVSGTVLLDLLHHRLPSVVLYKLESRRVAWMGRHFLTAPWFSSINLLANREVVPEFSFCGDGPREDVASALRSALEDDRARARTRMGLDHAARRLGPAGAAGRAAREGLALALKSASTASGGRS
jgi:lipid-A-disaccharide synthase